MLKVLSPVEAHSQAVFVRRFDGFLATH